MTFRRLLAGVLALGLSACASDETDLDALDVEPDAAVVDPMITEPADPMTDDTSVTAQATVDAVTNAGGLMSLPLAAATANVDSWIAKLDGNAAAAPVVANLRTLHTQLGASPIDGAAVGQTLTTLGEQTTAAAAGTGAQQASLETLGPFRSLVMRPFLALLALAARLPLAACADGEPDPDPVLDEPVPEVTDEMSDAADAALMPDSAAAMEEAFESDSSAAGF